MTMVPVSGTHKRRQKMNIEGLDYNTRREQLILPEYGREIHKMVNHALTIKDRAERRRCAETIVKIMERMFPQNRENKDYKQKLWDHLAIMSRFELDIDYPCDISGAAKISARPEPLEYPMKRIPVKHYGSMIFDIFEKLKKMPPGAGRDELTRITANQMKRNLMQWGHGSNNDKKIADDLEHYTDGAIKLDLNSFKFEPVGERVVNDKRRKKK